MMVDGYAYRYEYGFGCGDDDDDDDDDERSRNLIGLQARSLKDMCMMYMFLWKRFF